MRIKESDILNSGEALQELLATTSRADWFLEARSQLVNAANSGYNACGNKKELLASEWADYSAQISQHYSREERVNAPHVFDFNPMFLTDWVRFQLIADMLVVQPLDNRKALLIQCLRYADDTEKQSLIKGLELLDPTGECKDFVVNMFRSHNLDVLMTIALGNRWPAAHFSDEEFEQIILKCLHLNFDIANVVGLNERHTIRTSRIAFDFLMQQCLANRKCHQSIYLAIQPDDLLPEQIDAIATLPDSIVASLHANQSLGEPLS